MAILGQIRKRSIFLIIVIGMALFAFVISGVFTSNGGFSSNKPIGEINGEEIDFEIFNMMVEQAQTVYGLNTINAVNFAWNQGIKNQSLIQELDKLGIDAGKNQLEQIISSDESIVLNPLFQNEIGLFDFNKFSNYIAQLKTSNPTIYNSWRLQEENIISLAKQKIYFDLIKSSVIYTNVESNIQYHLENDKVNIEYLRIPYELVPDSLIKIKDSEINSYLRNKKDVYEIGASKKVEFVYITDVASDIDVNNIRTNLEQLKDGFNQLNQITNSTEYVEGFSSVKDYSEFIDIYSEVAWDSIYKTKQELSSDFSDILYGLNVDQVFGPYQDGNFYKITRMIDKKRDGNLNKVLLADVAIEIIPSNESSNENFRKASQVEFDANNGLSLNQSDASLQINTFESFEDFDEGLPGIINSRQVIKWMYDDDSRVGDVRRFTLNDGYLVAKIIEFNKTRLPNIEDVRTEISQILIQNKKYDFLKNKYNSALNIDIIAEENNLEVENASAVTQYDPILVGAGVEPYIIGSSFSLEPDEISELLKGNNGVYIIRLLSKEIAEEINLGQAISNSLSDREIERISTLIPEVLESKAEIVDNRSFYY
ncbi:MAG: SurA N-terminal domain-containing protein [Flavobacteriaceae bacterium]|nr:SurA N-terminal domain-containing protein [Flavobacteriaceae bacterium]MBL6678433.1 SurA N-terminal domain-containing protein [Flavobacteriaceae bacterium]